MYFLFQAILILTMYSPSPANKILFYYSIIAILLFISVYLFLQLRSIKRNKIKSTGKLSAENYSINRDSLSPDQLSPDQWTKILAERNMLFSLINRMPDRIYFKDHKSRFILGNDQMAKIMKLEKPEDLIGKTDFDFHTKNRANDFFSDEQDLIKGKVKIIKKEEKSINEAGEEITVYTTKVPMIDNNGNIIGIMGIGRDISDLKAVEKKNLEANEALQEVNILLEERQEEIQQQAEELKVQTEKLIKDRNQILALINNMPDRIYLKDRESRFILGNINVATIMGAKNPDELVGKTDYDFYPKEFADNYFKDEQELMEKDIQIINKEEKGYNSQRKEIIVSTTKVPIKDENGEIIGIVGIGRDITSQKEVEKQLKETSDALQETNVLLEERQEEIFQQSEELKAQTENLQNANLELEKLSIVASKTDSSIIILDDDGNFEYVNDGFINRYGMNLEEFVQARGGNLRQNSSSKEIVQIFEKIKENKKPDSYVTQTTNADGHVFWSQTSITPILDSNGDITRMILIDIDITNVKEAEEKISLQRDELKTLNATKDKFFSIIAHDLKNPFHSIMGFSELLFRNFNAIEDEKKVEFIKLINESSTSAYGLLENLLNWARTQTNKISYNPSLLDLGILFAEVSQMLMVNAKNKGITLYLQAPVDNIKVFADYNMINTILRNLISNSLKYTEAGGEIIISAMLTGEKVRVSIKDTGIGMSREVMDKLFRIDEFHSKAGTLGETGTGLGLIICQEFALRHDSKIEVESEPGKGSNFSFVLDTKEP
ncbi:MAG: PAS domain S-box protein [Bacteroidales bacterium]|nr:PAS domain S-box protein [Bacteroidales bacterium]MCF8406108.1 PAS domain S-box protein [Bacteroidales bacterium]